MGVGHCPENGLRTGKGGLGCCQVEQEAPPNQGGTGSGSISVHQPHPGSLCPHQIVTSLGLGTLSILSASVSLVPSPNLAYVGAQFLFVTWVAGPRPCSLGRSEAGPESSRSTLALHSLARCPVVLGAQWGPHSVPSASRGLQPHSLSPFPWTIHQSPCGAVPLGPWAQPQPGPGAKIPTLPLPRVSPQVS